MERGDLYVVPQATKNDLRRQRVYVVVSRQLLIDSQFSSVICAPVYTRHDSLRTQVVVGINEGLKHESSVHCDELVSVPKSKLTHYVGRMRGEILDALDRALLAALHLEDAVRAGSKRTH